MVDEVNVGVRYFQTIGLRLVRGRTITAEDGDAGREGVVVDQRFVDRFLTEREPLGASVTVLTDRKTPERVTIVGVVPTLGESEAREARPVVYRPYGRDLPPYVTLIARLRSEDAAAAVATQLRGEVRALDADLPLYDVRTLDEVLSWLLWANRVFGGMFAIFAGIAVHHRDRRHLRCRLVRDRSAYAGDRHSHGTWRAARAAVVDDDGAEDRAGHHSALPLGLPLAFVLLGSDGWADGRQVRARSP